jgi:hypothetical protein
VRHTKKSVVARTRREFTQLDRVVRRLRRADWKRLVPRPEARAPWTVKDALAHILYWKEHTCRVFRGEPRLPEMRGLGIEQMNRKIYNRWRRRRPAALVAWHRRVHSDVMKTLAKTPTMFFSRKNRGQEWPLDFDGHSAAHRIKDIEAALQEARNDSR